MAIDDPRVWNDARWFSVQAQILVYIEDGNIADVFDFNDYVYTDQNMRAQNLPPAVRLCPSERQRGVENDFGWNNYHANAGSWAQLKGWDGVFGPRVRRRRNACALPPLRLAKIIDGTSKTAALAEVVNGPELDDLRGDPVADCFEFGGMPVPVGGGPFSLAKIRSLFAIKDWTTSKLVWGGDWRLDEASIGSKEICG